MSDFPVSIILPVYNQADHIGEIVYQYEEALTKVPNPHELVLVLNGCRDRSLEVCSALAEQYDTLKIVCSKQGGWGTGSQAGH